MFAMVLSNDHIDQYVWISLPPPLWHPRPVSCSRSVSGPPLRRWPSVLGSSCCRGGCQRWTDCQADWMAHPPDWCHPSYPSSSAAGCHPSVRRCLTSKDLYYIQCNLICNFNSFNFCKKDSLSERIIFLPYTKIQSFTLWLLTKQSGSLLSLHVYINIFLNSTAT